MNSPKPEYSDFGISERQYRLYQFALGNLDDFCWHYVIIPGLFLVLVVVIGIAFLITREWEESLAIGFGIWILSLLPIPFAIGILIVLTKLASRFAGPLVLSHLMESRPLGLQIRQYEAAEAAYRAAQEEAARLHQEKERARQEEERARQEKLRREEEARREVEQARLAAERIRRRKIADH